MLNQQKLTSRHFVFRTKVYVFVSYPSSKYLLEAKQLPSGSLTWTYPCIPTAPFVKPVLRFVHCDYAAECP